MIDYYAAYSPYAMLLIATTIACVVFGAFLCAYGFIKVGKGFLFWVVIITLLGFLCLPVMGFMALVSPSLELQNFYLASRRFIALFAAVPLLCIVFSLYRGGCGFKQYGAFGLVFLIHIMCVFYLWEQRPGVLADYFPVLDFGIFSILLTFTGRSLFVELSPVSIDNFMQEIDDMILIFEKSGKLIDANRQAKKLWTHLHDGLPIDEFFKNLKAITISKKYIEKKGIMQREELALSFPTGTRHYQYGTTQIKDKMGNVQATVLNFHDITEESLLEKELEKKNDELVKLNIQLKTFLDTAEKLVEEEQKAKAAKDIKEAVSIKIEKLLSELESVSFLNKQEKLPDLIENCREAMAGVRLAMQKLMLNGGKDGKND
ncbi:MAG: PAS domain-containing protein [Peptococcaceae bacterium]|nr:PAS domain-containing protein [Peptococcaceae bacterium]